MAEPFRQLPDLEDQLRRLLAQVPVGRVTTYGALAEALGNSIAARWVGHFMLHHDHDDRCACHRVVRADGQLGQYVAGDPRAKAKRLAAEGVAARHGAVDLDGCRFNRFVSDRPLERLKRVQEELLREVVFRRRRRVPKRVAGVDVSYPEPNRGVAAYAEVDSQSGQLAWSITVERPVAFPYITSYLAFRELPILLELVDQVRAAGRLADVLLVDGSGILHQRRAGIATHLGIAASVSTVGVTKKLLCGRVAPDDLGPLESRPVEHEDRVIGVAIRPTAGSRRPIFVSP
ncbi:MAG: endonuclease V [Planctomycetota bacterium]